MPRPRRGVEQSRHRMWGHRAMEHPRYEVAGGNVFVLCPWPLVDFGNMTSAFDPNRYVIT